MNFATVFMSGNSQAVRLPKEFRLQTNRVRIERHGSDLVLRPVAPQGTSLASALELIRSKRLQSSVPDDEDNEAWDIFQQALADDAPPENDNLFAE